MAGFWRAIAKGMLDKKEFERAEQRQQEHNNRSRGSSRIGRRDWSDARNYWEESRIIGNASTPLSHLRKSDLGHPPGCHCPWC